MWTRPNNLRQAAKVSPVREISLNCSADWQYWQNYLAATGLFPTKLDGKAQLLISGTSTRFWGIPFRELVFAVYVARELESPIRDGAFLIQAFNSVKAFAWIERTVFATPYDHGNVQVENESAISVELRAQNRRLIRFARKIPTAAEASASRDVSGCIPIFLPVRGSTPLRCEKLFYGQMEGETQVVPFTNDDSLEIADDFALFKHLRESNFSPQEWHLRPAATHAKSVTIRRPPT